jgi:hypothetical protein
MKMKSNCSNSRKQGFLTEEKGHGAQSLALRDGTLGKENKRKGVPECQGDDREQGTRRGAWPRSVRDCVDRVEATTSGEANSGQQSG